MNRIATIFAIASAMLIAGCTTDDYGYQDGRGYARPYPSAHRAMCRDYGCRYQGNHDYRARRESEDDLGERSNYRLDPWLAYTREGQNFVLSRFDHNRNRRISEDDARKANREFRRFADRNRDYWLTDQEIDSALRELANRRWQRTRSGGWRPY